MTVFYHQACLACRWPHLVSAPTRVADDKMHHCYQGARRDSPKDCAKGAARKRRSVMKGKREEPPRRTAPPSPARNCHKDARAFE